jgi:transcriptional regulator with XRE-family HTH domain
MRIDIGKRLRELRLVKGVSVADLEARTGIPQDRIAAVEEGTETLTLNALEAWAGALGVEMHELFFVGKGSPSPEQQDGIGKLSAREKKLLRLFRSFPKADQGNLLFFAKKMAGLEPRQGGS